MASDTRGLERRVEELESEQGPDEDEPKTLAEAIKQVVLEGEDDT